MATLDSIEIALTAPIDWEKFEKIVAELLAQDDFPRLRKLGMSGDQGADCIEEVFYGDESRIETVIQVTSEKAQLQKYKNTYEKLKKNGVTYNQLVMVYRHPVSSLTKIEIQKEALGNGVLVDIRDRSYLITQLSKAGSNIFSRYFQDLRKQVEGLLNTKDPLNITNDTLKHAMLASMGAFVVNVHATLTRQTLFQKTVLAAIVANGDRATITTVSQSIKTLLPNEIEDNERIRSAIESLKRSGDVILASDKIIASEKTLKGIAQVIAASASAYTNLIKYVFENVCRGHKIDDASKGYLERNIRRSLLALIRAYGPIGNDHEFCLLTSASTDLLTILSKDLTGEISKRALFAITAYVENKENTDDLKFFVRNYTSLAIRNIDPIGRRWQKSVMERSVIALDTDAVLLLLIEDLPESKSVVKAINSLHKSGAKIAISPFVLDEVIGHIGRAAKTYRKFQDGLHRMSPQMVDGNVWHAIVRGFYYACNNGFTSGWQKYWERFFDKAEPLKYVKFIISKRISFDVLPLEEVPQEWLHDLEIISKSILENKERHRWKADFRDEEQKQRRTREDIRMAMHLAKVSDKGHSEIAKGYLVSEDRGFVKMENSAEWRGRPKVQVFTRALPEMAEFITGDLCDDEQIVKLLFDPIVSASAYMIGDEIQTLTMMGVDLKNEHVDRLEWDLTHGLQDKITEFNHAVKSRDEQSMSHGAAVLSAAKNLGYNISPIVSKMVDKFDSIDAELSAEKTKRIEAEKKILQVALAAGATTEKGRRRVNRMLRTMGIDPEELKITIEADHC